MLKTSDVITPLKGEYIFLYFITTLKYFHIGVSNLPKIVGHQVTLKKENEKPHGLIT